MRSSILIALALLTGMSSAWAQNDSHRTDTMRHAEGACAVKIDANGRSAVEAGDIGGLLSFAGELRRASACMRPRSRFHQQAFAVGQGNR
jgi:hypothetical protein